MLFMSLTKSLKTSFRMVKNILLRPLLLLNSRITSLFNLTSVTKPTVKIQKAFSGFIKGLKVKPTAREDFIDVGTVYVAKKLIVSLVIIISALIAFIYFLGWPWFSSNFLTARFYEGQSGLSSYSGKVEVYYDKNYQKLMFKGKLDKGQYTGSGIAYYKNGAEEYDGTYTQNKYDGAGTYYSSDGRQIYTGGFKTGKYSGQGTLLMTGGDVYKGDFANGKASGRGQIFKGNTLIFDGNMKDGMKSGSGKSFYDDGSLQYSGAFDNDTYEGDGTEYFDKKNIVKYKGSFKDGLYSGKGILNDEKGILIYEGSFANGRFDGTGSFYGADGSLIYEGSFANGLYDGNGKLIITKNTSWYEGSFTQGKESGSGKLYENGELYYDGNFANGVMSGNGKLTLQSAGFEYDGLFENNDIDFGSMFKQKVPKIYGFFTNGMTEDISKPDAFYLYSTGYGTVLKFSYANGGTEAALTEAYTLPVNSPFSKIMSANDIKLTDGFKIGATGSASPDAAICSYLSIPCVTMKTYKIILDGYGICYYTDSKSGEIKLIEYYPVTTGSQAAQSVAASAAVQAATDNEAAKTAAYFKDVGLDIADFHSLGY